MFTLEVAKASGASFRQLDYWARNGVLVPTIPARGSGSKRQYTRAQARIAAVLVRLSAMGMRREAMSTAARELAGRDGGMVVIDEHGKAHDPEELGCDFGWYVNLDALGGLEATP